jgi:ABC-2 type transport system ATP-binding protein
VHVEDGDADAAARTAREAGPFGPDATIETTADGISVTARDARTRGTDLLVTLRDAGFTVTGFNVRAPTLDDVFLAITGEHVPDVEAAGTDEDAAPSRSGPVGVEADR